MKSSLSFLLIAFFFSCKGVKSLQGIYYLQTDRLISNKLELKSNNTFFQQVRSDMCYEKVFFGEYSVSGKNVVMRPLNNSLLRYSREDKVFYRRTADSTNQTKLAFYANEEEVLRNADIYLDSIFLGQTDNKGEISLPKKEVVGKQITIGRIAYGSKKIFIDSSYDYNEVFISLYYTTLLPCIDSYFEDHLFKSSRGLELDKDIARKERKKYAYFKKIKEG